MNTHESPRGRARQETTFFKDLFMKYDKTNSGVLLRGDIVNLARKHLKIAERLVSDQQLYDFFSVIDADSSGEIDFTEFLNFVRTKEDRSHLNGLVMHKVKRAVRLAIQRKGLTLSDVEWRFKHLAEEGVTEGHSDGLGLDDMRRFFRRVLDISMHEATDSNLATAFAVMDEDGGGILDAEELMAFLQSAVKDQSSLTQAQVGPRKIPKVLCGMSPFLPPREPNRPGSRDSTAPFCYNGRELAPRMRLAVSEPNLLESNERPPAARRQAWAAERSPPGSRPSSASSNKSLRLQPVPRPQPKEARGAYAGKTSNLNRREAATLNRLEARLLATGVDMRGHYHRS